MASIFGSEGGETITASVYQAESGAATVQGGGSPLTSSGNDTVAGNGGNDSIAAAGGADSVDAGAGNDTLDGGDGNDFMGTGEGNDSATGGAGFDIVVDTGGNDTLSYAGAGSISVDLAVKNPTGLQPGAGKTTVLENGGTTGDYIAGFEAIIGSSLGDSIAGDTLDNALSGGDGADTLLGRAGADTIDGGLGADTLSGGDGIDLLSYADGGAAGVAVTLGQSSPSGGAAQGDSVAADFEMLRGGAGGDTLGGAGDADTIWGGGGGDSIGGAASSDLLVGEAGADTLRGGAGADTLDGSAGSDAAPDIVVFETAVAGLLFIADGLGTTVSGGGYDGDVLIGIEGAVGTGFADTMQGRLLSGLDGADSLVGSAGSDTLDGGIGADTTQFGPGADNVFGGDGTDLLDGSAVAMSMVVNLSIGLGAVGVSDGGGGVVFNYGQVTGFEEIRGGSGIDTLAGDTAADILRGGEGGDSLVGAQDADTLAGGGGADRLVGGAGGDSLAGGDGTDRAIYQDSSLAVRILLDGAGNASGAAIGGGDAAGDTLVSIEALTGSAQADTLRGRDMDGGDGADTLDGTAGADTLLGGAGDDTLSGNAGGDLLRGASSGPADLRDIVTYAASGAAVRVLLDANGDAVGANVAGGHAAGDTLQAIDGLIGSGFADTLRGRDLTGGAGADTLVGTTGADTLRGGTDGDTLDGLAGADSMVGGLGNDVFVVAGADTLSDTGGFDTVRAGVTWTLAADYESLVLTGGAAVNGTGNTTDNRLDGNGAANRLAGLDGADTLLGAAGADSLAGGAGNDSLGGGDGADTLLGNGGADTLAGGLGGDRLEGGLANDVFRFASTALGADTIANYVSAEDTIVVSAAGFGGGLVAGALPGGRFISNGTGLADPAKVVGHFIWETDTNTLWWDPDGNSAEASQAVLVISGLTGAMAATEILVIA